MSIRILSENLINKIAAGEVVEDPLSVVKELVENSVDAGSSTIEVELIGGGHKLVRVSDDGCGMGQDDAVLCFERHATSKIRSQEDLFTLTTMGFRGEALASIASIARVELKTAMKDKIGSHVEIHGGKILRVLPLQRAPGTTIEVRDLFFATPARKKFQKSSATSSAKIEKWLACFSLGYQGIRFVLRGDDRHFDFDHRLDMVFGKEFSSHHFSVRVRPEITSHFVCAKAPGFDQSETTQCYNTGSFPIVESRELSRCPNAKVISGRTLSWSDDEVSIDGLIGHWQLHRPQRSGQVIFVNNRIVDAPLISFAVREAYAARLPQGRHPLFVLRLTLPSHSVDVNVHPQKREVRFSEDQRLKQIVRHAVSEALNQEKSIDVSIDIPFGGKDQLPWMEVLEKKHEKKPREEPVLPLRFAPQVNQGGFFVEALDHDQTRKGDRCNMFERRIEAFIESIHGLPCLIEDRYDLYYFTGLNLSSGVLLLSKKKRALFVDGRYFERAKQQSVVEIFPSESFKSCLEGCTVVIFDSAKTSVAVLQSRQEEFPRITWKARPRMTSKQRAVKDNTEQELMRKAAALTKDALRFAQSATGVNATEEQVAWAFEKHCREHGAERLAFDTIVAFGSNSAFPHHRAGKKEYQGDETLLIDAGAVFQAYAADVTRTIVCSSPEMQKLQGVVRDAQTAALEKCRAGVCVKELDLAAREVMRRKDLERFFTHGLGHGIGLETHEYPRLSFKGDDADVILEEGMVITIEPGLYIPGLGGVRREDTVVVREVGVENFYNDLE